MPRKKQDHHLAVYRRHSNDCPIKGRPKDLDHCSCSLWSLGRLHGRLVRVSLETRSPAEAFIKRDQLLALPPDPSAPVPGNKVQPIKADVDGERTLESAEAAYIEYKKKNVGDRSETLYTKAITRFRLWAATQKIDGRPVETVKQVTSKLVGQYFEDHQDCWKSTTTNQNQLSYLHTFFVFCVDKDWIAKPPTKSKTLRDEFAGDKQTGQPYSDDEIAAIWAAIERLPEPERTRARALISLMLGSGMRICDTTFCDRSYINQASHRLRYVQIKTRKAPKLPVMLDQSVIDTLNALPESRVYFFVPDRDDDYRDARATLDQTIPRGKGVGRRARAQNFARVLGRKFYNRQVQLNSDLVEKVLVEAGLRETRRQRGKRIKAGETLERQGLCHRFRDTFAVKMLLKTRDIYTVSMMLGHTDVKVTIAHYMTFLEKHLHELSESAGSISYPGLSGPLPLAG